MTFKNKLAIAGFTLLALSLTYPAAAAAKQQHNFVVLVPETMQAANVNESSAPTLARLRAEGVYFINSYAGFPDLTSRRSAGAVSRRSDSVGALVGVEGYTSVYLDGPAHEMTDKIIESIERSAKGQRPFLIVCTIRGLGTSVYAPARPLRSGSPGTEGAAGALLRHTDFALRKIEEKLRELGVFETTNIIVAAEQGRSTIWKRSRTSRSMGSRSGDIWDSVMPAGFLAIDLIKVLLAEDGGLSLFDPNEDDARLEWWAGQAPSWGDATIGVTASSPYLSIEARGGYDLIFLPQHLKRDELRRRARSVMTILAKQDYVSGVFVNQERLGKVDGALSIQHLGADERSGEDLPDLVVNFASVVQSCGHPTICTIAIADTAVQEGNDLRDGFSRAETFNFIAARGPDFQEQLISRAPASTLDLVWTVRALVGERSQPFGLHRGRVLTESLRGKGHLPEIKVRSRVIASRATDDGGITEVYLQSAAGVDYLVAAGSPGRTVGVPERPEKMVSRWEWPRWRRFSITISPD